MPSPQAILRLVCALGGLTFAGCYAPYRPAPYNPYGGIPTYPQAIPVQPQLAPPAGTISPGGTFPPANGFDGTTITPTPDPGASGTFPPSNPAPYNGGFNPSLPSNTSPGLVPNYGEPESLQSPSRGGTFGGDQEPFQQDGARFEYDDGQAVGSVPFERDADSEDLQLAAHQSVSAEPEPEMFAAEPEPEMFAADEPKPQGNAVQRPNPYGYDAVAYRWLRGIVDFDEQQQRWILIYNPNPGPRDTYKGQIALINNGQLQNIHNNDVVLVEGQVEFSAGLPQYRISKLYGPLVPKT